MQQIGSTGFESGFGKTLIRIHHLPTLNNLEPLDGLADFFHESLAVVYPAVAILFGMHELTIDSHFKTPCAARNGVHPELRIWVKFFNQAEHLRSVRAVTSRTAVVYHAVHHGALICFHLEVLVHRLAGPHY